MKPLRASIDGRGCSVLAFVTTSDGVVLGVVLFDDDDRLTHHPLSAIRINRGA